MRMARGIIALTVGFVTAVAPLMAGSSPAHAQSDKVVKVIKTAAWARVLAERCPKVEMNWTRFGAIMVLAGLSPGDIEPSGKHGKLMRGFVAEALKETKETSDAVNCSTALVLYGRSGRNVPDLLAAKE